MKNENIFSSCCHTRNVWVFFQDALYIFYKFYTNPAMHQILVKFKISYNSWKRTYSNYCLFQSCKWILLCICVNEGYSTHSKIYRKKLCSARCGKSVSLCSKQCNIIEMLCKQFSPTYHNVIELFCESLWTNY